MITEWEGVGDAEGKLLDNPLLGHVFHEERGIRQLIFRKRYNVYYTVREDAVLVLFVFDGRMDINSQLREQGLNVEMPCLRNRAPRGLRVAACCWPGRGVTTRAFRLPPAENTCHLRRTSCGGHHATAVTAAGQAALGLHDDPTRPGLLAASV